MIRTATINDTDELARIRIAAIRELACSHYSAQQIDAWAEARSSGAFVTETSGKATLVEEVDGRAAGFAQADLVAGLVERLYVAPDHTRRGIASRLLDQLEAIAWMRGLKRLSVDATLNAVPFYESAGYASRGIIEHELDGGILFPCAAMHKQLVPTVDKISRHIS